MLCARINTKHISRESGGRHSEYLMTVSENSCFYSNTKAGVFGAPVSKYKGDIRLRKANVITKQYMMDNSKFADLCNYFLYNGEQIIKAEDLVAQDVTELALSKGLGGSLAVEKIRDILKSCCIKSADNVMYLIIGIENQSDIHYAMAVRNMLYDALNYTAQVNEYAKQHKKIKDLAGSEFLSGLSREDILTPVITLTITGIYQLRRQWRET